MVKIETFSLDNPPIVQTSEQAVQIPKIFGRARVAGQVIWADEFKIVDPNKKDAQVGLGFSLSFAIVICEGEIDHISKIWVNNQLHDLTDVNWRFYKGSATQNADPLLENAFGVDKAPAFRDIAYVIFEDLHLEPFGNLVPKFSFEVINAIGDLEKQIKAVAIIPGATEFGYHTISILRDQDFEYFPENQHGFSGKTDFVISIDELCNLCPNLEQVSLIVPWFGDDLRASDIEIRPYVDSLSKNTGPEQWSVGGRYRQQAKLVSQVDNHAAFGGTPSDASVIAAIQEFKKRGLKVTFYPFILMDVAADNVLPNPYGGIGQPKYPWRGRITCHPAIGRGGSPDQTAGATAQISQFFGTCSIADIQVIGSSLYYNGSGGWGYRRMILHYAKLCQVAGGVDAFLLGSELVGLMKVRDSRTSFPAVNELRSLAQDVRQILSTSKISYGADWSEYFGYHPSDGSDDILFHLDPLWADGNIDFVGIDAYWPLSDWRDNFEHIDKDSGVENIYNREYLQSQIDSGEGYDYHYSSVYNRNVQNRTPINDTAYGKHWVFRTKDIKSWWLNQHYNRIGGVEDANSTAWVAQSKPFWLTEIGCPAIDKGSNQPNVFYDPASSEGTTPYYAQLRRDDMIQRRYLEAFMTYYADAGAHNPVSNIYNAPMLEMRNSFIWAYDARPYPAFPLLKDVWADGDNWNYGHWLNGRLGAVPLDKLILQFTLDIEVDVSQINGQVEGYLIDRGYSPREILQEIMQNFGLVAFIRDDVLIFRHQANDNISNLGDGLFLIGKMPVVLTSRMDDQPTDMHLKYISDDGSYSHKVSSELLDLQVGEVRNIFQYQLPAVLSKSLAAQLIGNRLLKAQGEMRSIQFSIGAEITGLECGDVVEIDTVFEAEQVNGKWRIETIIRRAMGQEISAISINICNTDNVVMETQLKLGNFAVKATQGQALTIAMNLPLWRGETYVTGNLMDVAGFVKPWLNKLNVYQDIGGSFVKRFEIANRATIGRTLWDLYSGPVDRYDFGNRLKVRLYAGDLSSISEAELLAGKNLAAIQSGDGDWELFQFKTAVLTAQNEYEISHFIRGRFGTSHNMQNPVSADATFVLLDENIVAFNLIDDEILNEISMKYGPDNRSIDDVSYQTANWQHEATALKPFAPVHVLAVRNGDDIVMSWVRQTRFGGESWQVNQVALNEDTEAYELEIWSIGAGVMKRQLSSDEPTIIYNSVQQIADFGSLATGFKLKIYQISAIIGRGIAKEIEIYV